MTKSPKSTEKVNPETLEEAIEQIARLQRVTEDHSAEFQKMIGENNELKNKVNALFEERDRLKIRLQKKEDMRAPEALSHEVRTLRQEIGAKDSLIASLRKDLEKAEAATKEKIALLRAADQRFSNLENTASMMHQARDKAQSEANAALARLGVEELGKKEVEEKLRTVEEKLKALK